MNEYQLRVGVHEHLPGKNERHQSISERLPGMNESLLDMNERILDVNERLLGMHERLLGMNEISESECYTLPGTAELCHYSVVRGGAFGPTIF